MYNLSFFKSLFYAFILLTAAVSIDIRCMRRVASVFKAGWSACVVKPSVSKPIISKRRINIVASHKDIPHNYQAVISDFDDTIVKTESRWLMFIQKFCTRYKKKDEKIDLLESEINGLDVNGIYEYCRYKFGISENRNCFEQKIHSGIGKSYQEEGVEFIYGAEKFFREQSKKGKKLAIATNSSWHLVNIINKQLKFKEIFANNIYTRDDVKRGKPHPDIYLYAAKKLGVNPGNCIVLEDSSTGIKAAKDAGMFVIELYLNSRDDKESDEADMVVSSYEELDRLLCGTT